VLGVPHRFPDLNLAVKSMFSGAAAGVVQSPQGQGKTWRGTGGSHWRGDFYIVPSNRSHRKTEPVSYLCYEKINFPSKCDVKYFRFLYKSFENNIYVSVVSKSKAVLLPP
jgi:hypothetical protein